MDIINYFKDKWRGNELGGVKRSNKWSSVRKQYLKLNPNCAVCGKENRFLKFNEVHHIIPFSLDKTKELLFENLITLCPQDHFFCGHLNFYKSWNKNVKEDARNWHDKIYQRP